MLRAVCISVVAWSLVGGAAMCFADAAPPIPQCVPRDEGVLQLLSELEGVAYLGDVVVELDTSQRQALRRNAALAAHSALAIIQACGGEQRIEWTRRAAWMALDDLKSDAIVPVLEAMAENEHAHPHDRVSAVAVLFDYDSARSAVPLSRILFSISNASGPASRMVQRRTIELLGRTGTGSAKEALLAFRKSAPRDATLGPSLESALALLERPGTCRLKEYQRSAAVRCLCTYRCPGLVEIHYERVWGWCSDFYELPRSEGGMDEGSALDDYWFM